MLTGGRAYFYITNLQGEVRKTMRFKWILVIGIVIFTIDCLSSAILVFGGQGDAYSYGRLIGLVIEAVLLIASRWAKKRNKTGDGLCEGQGNGSLS